MTFASSLSYKHTFPMQVASKSVLSHIYEILHSVRTLRTLRALERSKTFPIRAFVQPNRTVQTEKFSICFALPRHGSLEARTGSRDSHRGKSRTGHYSMMVGDPKTVYGTSVD